MNARERCDRCRKWRDADQVVHVPKLVEDSDKFFTDRDGYVKFVRQHAVSWFSDRPETLCRGCAE